jgi:hypothetical protein
VETIVSNELEFLGAHEAMPMFTPKKKSARAREITDSANCFSPFKVELRFPHDEESRELARKLTRIFESCSFQCQAVRELSSPARGVRVESHTDSKHVASLIYDAFESAGIRATVASHPKAPTDTVIVHLGRSDVL